MQTDSLTLYLSLLLLVSDRSLLQLLNHNIQLAALERARLEQIFIRLDQQLLGLLRHILHGAGHLLLGQETFGGMF